MTKKIMLTAIAGLLLMIVLLSSVSAYKWACLSYGDSIPHFTCHFTHCKLCLDNAGYSTSFGYCDKAKQCSFGPANNDTTPPVLTVNSPSNNFIYNNSKVLFNLTIDEPSTIYYKNNQDNKTGFKMLAGNRLNYVNQLTFKDGFYSIIIRAEDRAGNDADVPRSFYVDTKAPKVDSPTSDANGNVKIKFEEANPVSFKWVLGNNKTGYSSFNIDLNNCNGTNSKYICIYNITKEVGDSALIPYDGQDVESWFELKDIAGNTGDSKILKKTIDLTPPVINNPENMVTMNGRYIYFNMSITEKNLLGVYYAENSTKLRWQKLCSALKNGYCFKKVNFPKGNHDIFIQVIDKAGNYITREAEFTIN